MDLDQGVPMVRWLPILNLAGDLLLFGHSQIMKPVSNFCMSLYLAGLRSLLGLRVSNINMLTSHRRQTLIKGHDACRMMVQRYHLTLKVLPHSDSRRQLTVRHLALKNLNILCKHLPIHLTNHHLIYFGVSLKAADLVAAPCGAILRNEDLRIGLAALVPG